MSEVGRSPSLTDDQKKFFELLAMVPFLERFWDTKMLDFHEHEMDRANELRSPGEVIMGSFFACVWKGHSDFRFDIFEAVGLLDEPNLKIIKQWVNDPFWP